MKKLNFFSLSLLIILSAGCTKTVPDTSESIFESMPGSVSAYSADQYKQLLSQNQMMALAISAIDQQGIPLDGRQITPDEPQKLNYLISSTKVQYTTKGPSGEDIKVSGRITFPFYPSEVRNVILCPMMTTMLNSLSPSVMDYAMPADLLAMIGYVVVSPDYIGYGDSKDTRHPYVHNILTGRTCTDMLDIVEKELGWYWKFRGDGMPKEIYIMGYSQGGAAALSCARYIEENRSGQYTILRTYAGDGPYSLSATMDYYRTNPVTMASVLPYVVLGLEYGDRLNVDLSNVFKEELYQNYQSWYFNKDKSTTEIDNLISHNGDFDMATDFLNDDFAKEDFGGNADIQTIYNACLNNDNIDWTPKSPILLYHSRNDEVVPFINASLAYDSFISRGADPEKIMLMTIKGNLCTHAFTAVPFYTTVLSDLQ